jgi:hypothetical protein
MTHNPWKRTFTLAPLAPLTVISPLEFFKLLYLNFFYLTLFSIIFSCSTLGYCTLNYFTLFQPKLFLDILFKIIFGYFKLF